MKKVTPRQIENAEKRLDGCPWCGVRPRIAVCDDEGNLKGYFEDDKAAEYLLDPWSGLGFKLAHDYEQPGAENCPIATHPDESLGSGVYWSLSALVKDWNTRKLK